MVNIEPFDYPAFADEGVNYLKREYGDEFAQAQESHSDIPAERKAAAVFARTVPHEQRIPARTELERLLKQGYLLLCLLNSKKLNGKDGYSGHTVVVKGFDEEGYFIHDPGLPPFENRKVPYVLFDSAWAYPSEKAKNVIALRAKDFKSIPSTS